MPTEAYKFLVAFPSSVSPILLVSEHIAVLVLAPKQASVCVHSPAPDLSASRRVKVLGLRPMIVVV